jgi:hypothetical protein
MYLIVRHNERSFHGDVLAQPLTLHPPFAGGAFPCLLWDHGGALSTEAKAAVARTLLQAGCRYAVCAGAECEVWHDVFDEVHVIDTTDSPANANEEDLVMTTWHHGEAPEDVAFFFVLNTNFGPYDFDRFLVLHVGSGARQQEVDDWVRRHALG